MSTIDNPKNGGMLTRFFGGAKDKVSNETSGENLPAMGQLMSAARNFPSLNVEDVMVPRADIIAVDAETNLNDLIEAFRSAGHSRLPVYKETLDEPIGMVHVKDLLPYLAFNARGRTGKTYPKKKIISKILRPVIFVPPSMQAQDLLRKMQALRNHMAIVVDEYGGTDGIVTMEDLIEPIIGDIEDEHDGAEPVLRVHTDAKGEKYWDADARVTIEDFEKEFGRDIATPEEEDDVDTLGGLVFSLAGRVPERREIIRHPFGLEFEILDGDSRRIKKVRVRSINHDAVDEN